MITLTMITLTMITVTMITTTPYTVYISNSNDLAFHLKGPLMKSPLINQKLISDHINSFYYTHFSFKRPSFSPDVQKQQKVQWRHLPKNLINSKLYQWSHQPWLHKQLQTFNLKRPSFHLMSESNERSGDNISPKASADSFLSVFGSNHKAGHQSQIWFHLRFDFFWKRNETNL